MSANPDAFKIQMELSEVIRLHNQTLETLRAFQHDRPYVVAPNILKMVEENLKENVAILYKQWNEVHKPPAERVRHVCQQCNFVFASALPGGICDECRSKGSTSQPAAYGAWPVTPESEAVTQSDATPLPVDVLEEEVAAQDASTVEDDVVDDKAMEVETPAPASSETPETADVDVDQSASEPEIAADSESAPSPSSESEESESRGDTPSEELDART